MAVFSLSTVNAADVATNGTITFAYPAGVTSANIAAGGEVLGLPSLQNVLDQAADTFTVAYSGSITVTYKDTTTIPAGSKIDLQIKSIDAADANTNLPAATATYRGAVKQAAHQADSVAADVATMKTDFNALLAKLQAAGVMAAS